MRTTIALDDDLIKTAQEYTGLAEKSALMREALKALIEREAARRLAELGGTSPAMASAPAPESNCKMILADTSVWVDHFRKKDTELYRQLQRNNISIHPFVVTELALGNLPDRQRTIASLDRLSMVKSALAGEVRGMIEAHSLFQRGIGFVDAHLIASTLITPQTVLWTRDRELRKIAATFGLDAKLS